MATTFDPHDNLATSLVATAPSPATTGTEVVVTASQGSRFPATGDFNATIHPDGETPTPDNSEIVRVTDVTSDTLTITREQEGTTARTVVVGDRITVTVTEKSLTDIEGALNTVEDGYDAYTPAASADWVADGQPTDQPDALDKLAARDADAYTPAASADWAAGNQPTGKADGLDILADRSTAAVHVLTYNDVDDYEPLNGAEIPPGAPRRFIGDTDPASAGGGSWSLVANVDEWLDTTA